MTLAACRGNREVTAISTPLSVPGYAPCVLNMSALGEDSVALYDTTVAAALMALKALVTRFANAPSTDREKFSLFVPPARPCFAESFDVETAAAQSMGVRIGTDMLEETRTLEAHRFEWRMSECEAPCLVLKTRRPM